MSKLDGNNRWSTKMIMTEHVEQYEQQRSEKTPDRMPTTKELTMMRDAIMLPHMLTIIQRGMERTSAPTTLDQLYKMAGTLLMDFVSRDLFALRRELKQREIRFWADEQDDYSIQYRYVCRGYEERFPIVREVLRAEISKRLAVYYADIAKMFREASRDKIVKEKTS